MNDPKEGKTFFKIMNDCEIMNDYKIDVEKTFYPDNAEQDYPSPAYIGSFVKVLPEEDKDKDGNLTLWRFYGKHDNREAAGACLIFPARLFAKKGLQRKIDEMLTPQAENEQVSSEATNLPLYGIVYKGDLKNRRLLSEKLQELAETLREIQSSNPCKKIIEEVRKRLDGIRFLFKSKHYREERELRIVRFSDPNLVDDEKLSKVKVDTNHIPPRFYLEMPSDFRFSGVILGPMAHNLNEWRWWLQKQKGYENLSIHHSSIDFGDP